MRYALHVTVSSEADSEGSKASWFRRAKGWVGLAVGVLTLLNILIAAAWCIYMYAVTTPARDQLATTHADLVGRWSGGALRIEIRPDATVSVNKDHTHYGGKVWRFGPDRDFSLWIFPVFRGRFHIEGPPDKRASGEEWLIVDGYHLRRERP
jgi:hypothetical protein